MKRSEVEKIVNLLNDMIEEDGIEDFPVGSCENSIIKEAIHARNVEIADKIELTDDQIKKLFRNQVPENFDISKVGAVRSPMTGDRVFLKYENEKRWIPDLETLERLGMTLADVKDITDAEMREIKEGFGLLSSKLW